MNDIAVKKNIDTAVREFLNEPLRQAALEFFSVLGYKSERTIDLNSVADFCQQFDPEGKLENPTALKPQWKSIHLLFQLTDSELSDQLPIFRDHSLKPSLLQSYMFFAVELVGKNYARGRLATIARFLNQLFPMPVAVLFKVDNKLSLAVINRRRHKRDESKDVLGKVTLIHNIDMERPHPGHLDILASFSTSELLLRKTPVGTFDELHAAWEEVFNVELLNKRFYQELSDWYFWARHNVSFPADLERDEENRNSTSVIRLITRLIFCWFLKEKGLLPDNLFDEREMREVLVTLSDDDSTYYRAILQNLFFATLNQQMNAKGKIQRQFAKEGGFLENRAQYGIKSLYRYRDSFRDPDNAISLFEDIPFLNGGLFTCLDVEHNGKVRYADGFSRNAKKQPIVPNFLFFSKPQTVNLSTDYGDEKKKNQSVRGLLNILRSYKFTIAENTPIEQEIALDPELLGKVFENLLASYNPETSTTARAQTGSFYTPRPIVDYMVDESLKAYLLENMIAKFPDHEVSRFKIQLDTLFAYTEREIDFSEEEIDTLIAAVDNCNILDPACGSGAFPMGILHKLVFILSKLDPHNQKWRDRQISKALEIQDIEARDSAVRAIERDFSDNDLDYGRKLYLIENCIYGVDIQPIAIQISKLRFFISLICDQKTNRDKAKNHGIRPLPNLETKFVTANTLIYLIRHGQTNIFAKPKVKELEKELESIRHNYFSAQTRAQKRRLEKKDRELCEMIIHELNQLSFGDKYWSAEASKKVASWNPYDPYSAATFFDPEWMFGPSLVAGFDIVIGNPPYVDSETMTRTDSDLRTLYSEMYSTAKGNWDLFVIFIERGLDLLKPKGVISYIVPNKLVGARYTNTLRSQLLRLDVCELRDFSKVDVFKEADVYPMVFVVRKSDPRNSVVMTTMNTVTGIERQNVIQASNFYRDIEWSRYFAPDKIISVIAHILQYPALTTYLQNISGAATVSEAYKLKPLVREVHSCPSNSRFCKMINTGTIDKYTALWGHSKMQYIKSSYLNPVVLDSDLSSVSTQRLRQARSNKIILAGMVKELECIYDAGEFLAGKSTTIIVEDGRDKLPLKVVLALLNSSLISFWYMHYYSSSVMAGGFISIKEKHVRQIPIANVSEGKCNSLIELVDLIRNHTRDANYFQSPKKLEAVEQLRKEIDQIVYDLYEIGQPQVDIIEGSAC